MSLLHIITLLLWAATARDKLVILSEFQIDCKATIGRVVSSRKLESAPEEQSYQQATVWRAERLLLPRMARPQEALGTLGGSAALGSCVLDLAISVYFSEGLGEALTKLISANYQHSDMYSPLQSQKEKRASSWASQAAGTNPQANTQGFGTENCKTIEQCASTGVSAIAAKAIPRLLGTL